MAKIELERDTKFHRIEYRMENFVWTLLLLFLVAALLGLFGVSPGSQEETSFTNGKLLYDKYLRRGTASSIDLKLSAAESSEVSVWVENSLLEKVEVENILPQPDRHEIGDGGIRFYFRTQRSSEPMLIRIRVNPEVSGWLKGALRINEGPEVPVHQFAYP